MYVYIYIWEEELVADDHYSLAVNNGQNRLEALRFIFLGADISDGAVMFTSSFYRVQENCTNGVDMRNSPSDPFNVMIGDGGSPV